MAAQKKTPRSTPLKLPLKTQGSKGHLSQCATTSQNSFPQGSCSGPMAHLNAKLCGVCQCLPCGPQPETAHLPSRGLALATALKIAGTGHTPWVVPPSTILIIHQRSAAFAPKSRHKVFHETSKLAAAHRIEKVASPRGHIPIFQRSDSLRALWLRFLQHAMEPIATFNEFVHRIPGADN